MARILILYSTTDGHTPRICARLQAVLEAHEHRVTVAPIGDAERLALADHDKIVLGASIRYGHHQPEVFDFIERHLDLLNARPNAFFTVNIVARKPEKCEPASNPYLLKFLRKIKWQPKLLGVFAGKLDYPRYRFFDRQMIRFIMLMTKGPTDPSTVVEFTDWNKVESFGAALSRLE